MSRLLKQQSLITVKHLPTIKNKHLFSVSVAINTQKFAISVFRLQQTKGNCCFMLVPFSCVCVCVCICVYIYTHNTRARLLTQQTPITFYCLPTKENKFLLSVWKKQMEVSRFRFLFEANKHKLPLSIYIYSIYIYIYWNGSIYI